MDAEFFGKKIGTADDYEWFEGVDQYSPFSPSFGVNLPECAVLELDSAKGQWVAYDGDNSVMKTGTITATFATTSTPAQGE